MLSKEQLFFIKLAEECSEVSKVALKIAQFGVDNCHPETGANNWDRLKEELDDLFSVVMCLATEFNYIYLPPTPAVIRRKKEKIDKYAKISHNLGYVESYN